MSEGVGYYNRFLGHSASALYAALKPLPIHRTLRVSVYDPPYYFLRVAEFPEGDRLQKNDALDADPYSDISVNRWSVVSVTHEMINIHPEIEQELLFLGYLGLAMHLQDSDEYAVSPDADKLLYGDSGIFRVGATPPESLTAFKKYLRDVVGPAYYWRSHYLTSAFPEDIYDTQEAQWIMEEASNLVRRLNISGDK